MTVKFGIKVGAMLSSLVLALVCFVGCNSDETTPAPGAVQVPRPSPAQPRQLPPQPSLTRRSKRSQANGRHSGPLRCAMRGNLPIGAINNLE